MPRLTCFGPRSASSSSCRVPSCPSQESTSASLNVAAGHSRQGYLRVRDAGNGRASAVAEGAPERERERERERQEREREKFY